MVSGRFRLAAHTGRAAGGDLIYHGNSSRWLHALPRAIVRRDVSKVAKDRLAVKGGFHGQTRVTDE